MKRFVLLRWAMPALFLLLVPYCHAIEPGELISISVKKEKVAKGRIVGIELELTNGRIFRLREVPFGWYFTIDNDASWKAKLTGTVEVGAAALDPSEINGLIVVEAGENSGPSFSLQLGLFSTTDFENSIRVDLGPKDLDLIPVRDKSGKGK